jgi:hypothetical protein
MQPFHYGNVCDWKFAQLYYITTSVIYTKVGYTSGSGAVVHHKRPAISYVHRLIIPYQINYQQERIPMLHPTTDGARVHIPVGNTLVAGYIVFRHIISNNAILTIKQRHYYFSKQNIAHLAKFVSSTHKV